MSEFEKIEGSQNKLKKILIRIGESLQKLHPAVLASIIIGLSMVVTAIILRPKEPPPDKIKDIQLSVGMTIEEIKRELGSPDTISVGYSKGGLEIYSRTKGKDWPTRVDIYKYGPFGIHSQKYGHMTRHRLTLEFLESELKTWSRSAPLKE